MNIYDEQLHKIEEAEENVRIAKARLLEAERKLDETLELTEVLFRNQVECVIEVKEDGKWKMVGLDKDDARGWSTNPTKEYKIFPNEQAARNSAIYRQLLDDDDKIEEEDFRINNSDGEGHR